MALEYPDDLYYLDSHEYIRLEDGVATIGITAYAVDQLGDIVYVGLPEEGTTLTKGDSFGTVESVKAVEELYAPVSGEVIAVNSALIDNPEALAADPYGDGWLLKIALRDPEDLEDTMSAEDYRAQVEGE
ncbi:MAG: glycine cleavage system protein GcvH [Thermostichales cyanobacterium BF4_bins_65]